MSFWDFLREIPFVDDIVDAGEAIAIYFSGSSSSEISGEAILRVSGDLDAAVSPEVLPDYGSFRDSMYWTEVGDTGQTTREWLLEQSSSVPVEKDSSGRIISGQWSDPHTGFMSFNPEDFDIDHRMPFHEVMSSYPEIYSLPHEEQLTIYNDLNNLQVIHDDHNIDKGAQSGDVHAEEIVDDKFRKQFLTDYHSYKESLGKRFSN